MQLLLPLSPPLTLSLPLPLRRLLPLPLRRLLPLPLSILPLPLHLSLPTPVVHWGRQRQRPQRKLLVRLQTRRQRSLRWNNQQQMAQVQSTQTPPLSPQTPWLPRASPPPPDPAQGRPISTLLSPPPPLPLPLR